MQRDRPWEIAILRRHLLCELAISSVSLPSPLRGRHLLCELAISSVSLPSPLRGRHLLCEVAISSASCFATFEELSGEGGGGVSGEGGGEGGDRWLSLSEGLSERRCGSCERASSSVYQLHTHARPRLSSRQAVLT